MYCISLTDIYAYLRCYISYIINITIFNNVVLYVFCACTDEHNKGKVIQMEPKVLKPVEIKIKTKND